MTITGTGLVGIGTTSVDSLLHLQGSNAIVSTEPSADDGQLSGIQMKASGGAVIAGVYANTLTGEVQVGSANSSYFTSIYGGVSERVRVSNNGNVHIGGTAAPNKFTVTHDEAVNTWASLTDAKTDAAFALLGSSHANGYGIFGGYANSANDAQAWQAIRSSDNTAIPLCLNPMGGNVGVNMLSPTMRHHAVGTDAAPATTGSADNGTYRVGGASTNLVMDLGVSSGSTYGWLQARHATDYSINYALCINPNGGNVGVGLVPTVNMVGLSIEAGVMTIKETTTPTADTNYGKVYTKSDNKLYFQDGAGTEHEIAYV